MQLEISKSLQIKIENLLKAIGIGGEVAFHILAYHLINSHNEVSGRIPQPTLEKWQKAYKLVASNNEVIRVLDEIFLIDPQGHSMPIWYQFFIGRKFREGSGKFFTPKTIAKTMAQMLPELNNAVVMDPACGCGTFLSSFSELNANLSCTLVSNDIELSLIDLTTLSLSLNTPKTHTKIYSNEDIYCPKEQLTAWYGQVDYILANPPFSLPVDAVNFDSTLFTSGYKKSDALFIDIAYHLLKPSGRLVCLLPHSFITNKEFSSFRNLVEKNWHLRAVICLPEGVFALTAGTTTRADILVLDKSGGINERDVVFASVPSVGFKLSNRDKNGHDNHLDILIQDEGFKTTLGI